MTEHEQLKWICDTIGYIPLFEYKPSRFNAGLYIGYIEQVGCELRVVNVREIIFTTEFMDKLSEFIDIELPTFGNVYWRDRLLENLDDPTSYLYNLLGGPTQENK